MPKLGLGLLLAFVASQAIRDVYLGHLFGNLGLFDVALIAFGTVSLVFGGGVFLFQRRQIRLLRRHWRDTLWINATTALAWLSYFGALRLVEPAAANLTFAGVAPLAIAVLGAFGLVSGTTEPSGRIAKGLHVALFATVLLLAGIVATGHSGFADIGPVQALAGLGLAAVAGISITAETIVARRMNAAGISALSIVGVRFTLVTAIAATVVMASSGRAFGGLGPVGVAEQSLIFLAILVAPIYLAQAGLRLTGPLVSGVILSLGPVTTLALQSAVGAVALAPAMAAVTGLYAVFAIAAAVIAAGQTVLPRQGTAATQSVST